MNKRQFDLSVGVFIGAYAVMTGFRLWTARYLIEGKPNGPLHDIAEVLKAVTG
jgi:hypothetical protein